ncbi:MAG: glycoside hydrolase family 3 C-terminal domain-containing protein [Lachnospiraceae bacterium]|nr:glycoside hydrolase family 3 C-terminal domain-containing protein [Lachnospiraceae bacterium]
MDVNALLKKMTLRQKIGQLTQYNAALFTDSEAAVTGPAKKLGLSPEDLKTVGSVLNFSGPAEMKRIQDEHLAADPCGIPMVFMMDVIHGYRTVYPIPLAMACSFDPELVRECARMAAREASASGVQVDFAPMVDYVKDARWGRIMESSGEEPLLAGIMGAAQVSGYRGEGIDRPDSMAACVKHFAAYGLAEAGRDYNQSDCSERELREHCLPAYKACLDARAKLVMPSFQSMNGVPSTVNPLLHRVLREEWGYDGVVISDYNAIGELKKHGVAEDEKQAAQLAFGHECDVEMCSAAYFHSLEELLAEGKVTEEQIDRAVLRVLRLKEELGLFEDPYHGADEERAQSLYLCGEHRALARRAAEEAAVLLKNDGLLPFDEGIKKIAVIGPFADEHGINGSWSCRGRDEDTVTVRQGLSRLLGEDRVIYAPGCEAAGGCEGLDKAEAAAKAAEAAVLCLGEPQGYSGEGNCRTDIRLPGMQSELARRVIAANPNTAVLIFSGRPLAIPEIDEIAPAIMQLWFPGTEGGNAAADLLFGRANPSGRLAMSFPRSVGQCPVYYDHTSTGRPHFTDRAEHRGYASDYIDCAVLPLYSFGHGLSYSEFIYEEMTLSSHELKSGGAIEVNVRIRNNGRAGSEVVQLYMRDIAASCTRPVQKLIAFEKVHFEAGGERTVTFRVTEEMLGFWNFDMQFVTEKGDFELMIGYADHFVLRDRFRYV